MGTYMFRWDKAATEVFVTGTFDNWQKTVQLKKENGHFEKQVDLSDADSKIQYKFVVDGIWTIDPSIPTENDALGNANNVLTPEEITKIPAGGRSGTGQHETPNTVGAVTSGEGPGAATHERADLPPQAPDLDNNDDKMPGAFPDPTPGEEGTYTPIQLFPGDMVPDYSTYFGRSHRSSKVNKDTSSDSSAAREQSFGVNPIPASGGHGNPVSLQPGESVPPHSEVTSNTVESTVTTDKESYEKSGSAPFSSLFGAGGAAIGGAAVGGGAAAAAAAGSDASGRDASSLPEKSDTMIPESSLPMGEGTKDTSAEEAPFMRSSAGGDTSTSQLAGQVPLEKREDASSAFMSSSAGADTSTSQLAGQVPLEKREDTSSAFMPSSAGPDTSTSALAGEVPKEERGVPEVVQDSQESANEPPEASQSPEAVTEKQDVESELLDKVPEQQPTSEGEGSEGSKGAIAGALAGAGAAIAGGAAYASQKTGLGQSKEDNTPADSTTTDSATANSTTVPEMVQDSQTVARETPEASASPTAVAEKSEMEKELKDAVPEEKPTSEETGLGSSQNDTSSATEPSGVPDMVKDSQAEAGKASEATASAEAVTEKSEMEQELQSKVPEEQPTSEELSTSADKGMIGGAVAGAGAAAAGGLAYASHKAGVPQSIQDKINSMNAGTSQSQPADDVPRPVAESLEQSHQSPEAATNPEAVHEKTDMERELLQEVKKTDEAGEPAPVTSAEDTTMAPGTGAGIVSGTGAATAGGAAYASSTDPTSSRITDPTTIPSSDPNAMLADADTMPAIAMASRDGTTPYEGNSTTTDPVPATSAYSSYDTMPITTSSTYADRSVAQPEDSQASSVALTEGTSSRAQMIAARVMGGDSTTTAPVTSTSTTVPESTMTTTEPTTTTTISKGVFDDDPVTATGASAPAVTSDTDNLDPRTRASAFASDPISTSDGSTTEARTVTVPDSASTGAQTGLVSGTTTSGLNAPATAPAQSVSTETNQLANDENAKPQDTANSKPFASKNGPSATSSTPATTAAAGTATSTSAASGLQPGTDTKARQDSRDVSPFSSSRKLDTASSSGPQVTTGTATGGTASKTGPSTPQKAAAAAASKSSTPASSSSAAPSPASQGQSASAKKEKRKSRLSSFFSEHFGSERKGKK